MSNALRAGGGVAGPREGEEEGEERADDPPLTSPATALVGKTLSGRAYKPTGAMEAEDTANTLMDAPSETLHNGISMCLSSGDAS